MALWLQGWAGDHTGNLQGRESNSLLITFNAPDAISLDWSAGEKAVDPFVDQLLFRYVPDDDSDILIVNDQGGSARKGYYAGMHIECVAPHARAARAISMEWICDDWEAGIPCVKIGLLELEADPAQQTWLPGAHLFGVSLGFGWPKTGNFTSTFATAIIDTNIPRGKQATAGGKSQLFTLLGKTGRQELFMERGSKAPWSK